MEGNSIDDDDDGFDTEEFDSSDNNDETPPKPHSQIEYSPKTQAEVRVLYFSFNLVPIHSKQLSIASKILLSHHRWRKEGILMPVIYRISRNCVSLSQMRKWTFTRNEKSSFHSKNTNPRGYCACHMRVIYSCAASSEGCGLQGVYAK